MNCRWQTVLTNPRVHSYLSSINPAMGYSDRMSVQLTEKWAAGAAERAAFMNASSDEVGKSDFMVWQE